MMDMIEPFEFKECISIIKSTGRKASTLRQLRDSIADVSGECLFHHTYQYFLRGRMLEYTNDFAHWAGENLEERALAEQLSNIDPYDFQDIDSLRVKILDVIDRYLAVFPEPREAMTGEEFFFNEMVTLVFPIGIRAKNLAEFLIALRYISGGALYFHFYESRVRLGSGRDDFSAWIEDVLGESELAARTRDVDPFMHTIEGIRKHLITTIDEAVKRDMEVIADA